VCCVCFTVLCSVWLLRVWVCVLCVFVVCCVDQRELKLTMLFISHDLNVVEYIADTVGVMYAGKLMEVAPAEEIFKSPLHPYTKGLIASNPTPNPFAEERRGQLKGEVSLPINPTPGCRLEPRCPIRVERCKTVEPPLELKKNLHTVACHEV